MFVLEIPPGESTNAATHLYEDVYYVLEGSGSTQLEFPDGSRRSFEWGARSLFAIPLNAKHRHFNASGASALAGHDHQPADGDERLPQRSLRCSAPISIFSIAPARRSIFPAKAISSRCVPATTCGRRTSSPISVASELKSWGDRGAGGTQHHVRARRRHDARPHLGNAGGHLQEGPRHGPSFHVMCVTGQGYSLLWHEGEQNFRRIDWKHGVVLAPATASSTSNFNTGPQPARYLATAVGGLRYPTTTANRVSLLGAKEGDTPAVSKSVKEAATRSSTRTRTRASTACGSKTCAATTPCRDGQVHRDAARVPAGTSGGMNRFSNTTSRLSSRAQRSAKRCAADPGPIVPRHHSSITAGGTWSRLSA